MLKYLEIDSTYRDRNKFPNPSQFELLIAQSGKRDSVYTSVDPITYAAPRVTYIPSNINSITNTIISSSPAQTAISLILIFPTSFNVSKTKNYYRACQLKITYTPTGAITTSTHEALIDTWDYMTTVSTFDHFRVSINSGYPGTTSGITSVNIICTSDFSNGLVFIPSGEYGNQIYDDWIVYNQTKNEYTSILSYDGTYSLATILPKTNWVSTDKITIRKELPITNGNFQSNSSTTSLFISTTTSSGKNGYYNGMFIRFTSGVNEDKIYGIYSYVGSPNYKINLIGYVSSPPTSSDTYEILPFTKDNYNPFSYSGSIIQQESCYDVQLINLIMPNIAFASGGTIASYPYFYVELQNVSTAGGNTINVSYSNNPNSTKKLFRVPVSDLSTQADDAFLTLDRSNSLQTVRINPFGNFKFGVYLPDGNPVSFYSNDTESPYPPNPFLQVSAVFALRRIK